MGGPNNGVCNTGISKHDINMSQRMTHACTLKNVNDKHLISKQQFEWNLTETKIAKQYNTAGQIREQNKQQFNDHEVSKCNNANVHEMFGTIPGLFICVVIPILIK